MKIEVIKIDVANQGHITNTYLVYDEVNGKKEGILIDPADDAMAIIDKIKEENVNIKYIVITHAHGDHIGALEELTVYTKAKIIVHRNDKAALLGKEENYCDMLHVEKQDIAEESILQVDDNFSFTVLNMDFEIIHTPGHTSGSICIFEKNNNSLFTGDTIFCDCYGRCDLFSGSFEDMVHSLRKIFSRFDNVVIYPGHDKIVNISSAKKRIRMLIAMKGTIL